jgi:hypothetical protein
MGVPFKCVWCHLYEHLVQHFNIPFSQKIWEKVAPRKEVSKDFGPRDTIGKNLVEYHVGVAQSTLNLV